MKTPRDKAIIEAKSRKAQADRNWKEVLEACCQGNFDKGRIINAMIQCNQADKLCMQLGIKL